MNVRQAFKWISNLGVSRAANDFQARFVRYTNQVTLIAMLIMVGFNASFLVEGQVLRVAIQCSILLCMEIPVLLLNYRGKFSLARVLLGFAISLSIFIDANLGERIEGHQYFLLALAIGFGVLFEPTKWRLGVVMFFIPLSFWMVLEGTDYQALHFLFPEQSANHYVRYMNIGLAYVVVFAVVWRYSFLSMMAEKKAIHDEKMASPGQMAAWVGHEINNPLAVIKGHMELAENRLMAGQITPDYLRSVFTKVGTNCDRIHVIVESLRKFSRHSVNDPVQLVVVYDVVQSSLDMSRHRLTLLEIDLDLQVPESFTIEGHESELMQVVVNLVSNAIDAMQDAKERRLQIKAEQRGDTMVLSVSDTGLGVAEQHADRILQPFFTTKNPGKGTGLGLSISYTLIRDHGGEILLTNLSNPTTFEVHLPLGRAPSRAA